MNATNLTKLIIPALALCLSACSSSSGPASSGSAGSDSASPSGHTVITGHLVPGGPGLKGSGKWAATRRQVEQFHAIDVQDSVKVQITIGAPLSMSVEADDNLIDAIDTKVQGGKLVVSVNKSFQAEHAPFLIIGVPELSEINKSGSGDMIVSGVKGDVFKVTTTGSGNFYAVGRVTALNLVASGSGNVDCTRLQAGSAAVDLSGAGNCTVDAEKALTAKLTGAGNIKYKGSPASLTKSDTGAGTITALAPDVIP
jgi:hypothetical protein